MSRVQQLDIKERPCKKFLKWKTLKSEVEIDGDMIEKISGGAFVYWDKENEKNVEIKPPFKFALLNQDLVNISGYNEIKRSSVWSNEVKEKDHVINVRDKDGKVLSFKLSEYKLHKDAIKGFGGRYTKSVYCALQTKDGWEIINIQMSGSVLTGAVDMENPEPDSKEDGWFGFTKINKNKLYSNLIEASGYKAKKKGSAKFLVPTFAISDVITDAESEELNKLDTELNEFLTYYFDKPEAVKEEKKEETVDDTDY